MRLPPRLQVVAVHDLVDILVETVHQVSFM